MDEKEWLDADDELLMKIIFQRFPGKTLADVSDIEDENHNPYKALYDKAQKGYENLLNELTDVEMERDRAEYEMERYKEINENLHSINQELQEKLSVLSEPIKKFIGDDIVVSNIRVLDREGNEVVSPNDKRRMPTEGDLSLEPAVYEFKRPNWFAPASDEMTKETIAKSHARKTENLLSSWIMIWKKLFRKTGNVQYVSEDIDSLSEKRRKRILSLLTDEKISNEEKYIKYILLTPSLSKEYAKSINGASELGLNANVVIEFLEQPAETFNREMFEAYISKTHKGTDYNLKKELAVELFENNWSIEIDINGVPQKCKLAPVDLLENLKDQSWMEICP